MGDDGAVQFNGCGALSRRPAHAPPSPIPTSGGTAPDLPPAGCCAARSGWIPAGLPWLACVAGKVYFEVTVVEAAGGVCVGWAGTSLSGTAVGRDTEGASWGVWYDGDPVHRRALPPPPPPSQSPQPVLSQLDPRPPRSHAT